MKTTSLFFLCIDLCFAIHSTAQVVQTDSLTDTAFVKKNKEQRLHKQKEYFNNTQISIGVRLGLPVLSISTVNGYQFSRQMSLGLGVGYIRTNYPLWAWTNWSGKVTKSDYKVKADQFNVFIEQRIFFGKQKISPIVFYIFDFGYSFCLSPNDHELNA